MKKSTKIAYAVLGIVFIPFNVIVFAVSKDKTTFWISYSSFLFIHYYNIFIVNLYINPQKI